MVSPAVLAVREAMRGSTGTGNQPVRSSATGRLTPGDRILLLATICGAENIIVGLVRSWGGEIPWIAGCQLCEWRPGKPEDAGIHTLMGHLSERHDTI